MRGWACRARNLGLATLSGEWVLLLDDDVRLPRNLLAKMVAEIRRYGAAAVNVRALAPDEVPRFQPWSARPSAGVGSGRALIEQDALTRVGGFDEPAVKHLGEALKQRGLQVCSTSGSWFRDGHGRRPWRPPGPRRCWSGPPCPPMTPSPSTYLTARSSVGAGTVCRDVSPVVPFGDDEGRFVLQAQPFASVWWLSAAGA